MDRRKEKAMTQGRIRRLTIIGVFILGEIVGVGAASVQAASPAGVLKQATHWGISADWLDPATCGNPISAHLHLYLFHDSMLKAMPEEIGRASCRERV